MELDRAELAKVSEARLEEVTIGIRPEALEISDSGGVDVVVDLVEDLGSEAFVYTHAGSGVEFVARCNPRTAPRLAESVKLHRHPDGAVHLFVGKAKAGEHFARTGVSRIAVGAVEFRVQARLCGAVLGFLGLGQVVLHLTQAQIAIEHVVDCNTVEGVDLLAHMGDAPVGWQQAVPGIRGQLTQQQSEQRGFAGAVGTDQAGFVTGVQGQLGVFEKTLRTTL